VSVANDVVQPLLVGRTTVKSMAEQFLVVGDGLAPDALLDEDPIARRQDVGVAVVVGLVLPLVAAAAFVCRIHSAKCRCAQVERTDPAVSSHRLEWLIEAGKVHLHPNLEQNLINHPK